MLKTVAVARCNVSACSLPEGPKEGPDIPSGQPESNPKINRRNSLVCSSITILLMTAHY
jgi:hypothetical protein